MSTRGKSANRTNSVGHIVRRLFAREVYFLRLKADCALVNLVSRLYAACFYGIEEGELVVALVSAIRAYANAVCSELVSYRSAALCKSAAIFADLILGTGRSFNVPHMQSVASRLAGCYGEYEVAIFAVVSSVAVFKTGCLVDLVYDFVSESCYTV